MGVELVCGESGMMMLFYARKNKILWKGLCKSYRRTLIIRSWQTSVSVAHEGLATGMLGWHGTTCPTYTCTVALCPDRQLHCPAGLQEGTDDRRGCWGWHRATGCSFPLPGSVYHHIIIAILSSPAFYILSCLDYCILLLLTPYVLLLLHIPIVLF